METQAADSCGPRADQGLGRCLQAALWAAAVYQLQLALASVFSALLPPAHLQPSLLFPLQTIRASPISLRHSTPGAQALIGLGGVCPWTPDKGVSSPPWCLPPPQTTASCLPALYPGCNTSMDHGARGLGGQDAETPALEPGYSRPPSRLTTMSTVGGQGQACEPGALPSSINGIPPLDG